jgi:predicted metal-dependent hydrolase
MRGYNLDNLIKKYFKIRVRVVRRRIRVKNKKGSKSEYLKYKNQALDLVKNKLEHFNKFYNFKYNKVTVRNQSTRWGSCSKSGNLNFNYKLALLPENLVDYVVVHELCHLGEFNHSKNFWDLVARVIPDFKDRRQELRVKSINLS